LKEIHGKWLLGRGGDYLCRQRGRQGEKKRQIKRNTFLNPASGVQASLDAKETLKKTLDKKIRFEVGPPNGWKQGTSLTKTKAGQKLGALGPGRVKTM